MTVNKQDLISARDMAVEIHNELENKLLFVQARKQRDVIKQLEAQIAALQEPTDTELAILYRDAIQTLAFCGIVKDAEELIEDIESGNFKAEYEYIKNRAVWGGEG